MIALRGITVCIGYAHVLQHTLWRNMRHLKECVVITDPEDKDTQKVAKRVPSVRLHLTDAHRRHGAMFNKGLALEEGFDVLGRYGWIMIWDADIILPDYYPHELLRPGHLHGAKRHVLVDDTKYTPELDWTTLPVIFDHLGAIGYHQVFQAEDPTVSNLRPWYDVNWSHAGGCDSYFLTRWRPDKQVILPLKVLHLGPVATNWYGRTEEGRNMMAEMLRRRQWTESNTSLDLTGPRRPGPLPYKIQIPDYPTSDFEMP